MRIKEDNCGGSELYPYELHERVLAELRYSVQLSEIKRLLTEIRKEANYLRELFWTEEQLKEKNEAVSFFDARMQANVYYTLKNIEAYLQYGWKNLIYEGENAHEGVNSIQEKE